jgi:hypothetical protein
MPVASSQQFPRPRRPEPVLITEARPSLAQQHAARKKRYAITMAVRGVCVVLAASFYHVVWLMLIFAILGTVLPWVAARPAARGPEPLRSRHRRLTRRLSAPPLASARAGPPHHPGGSGQPGVQRGSG